VRPLAWGCTAALAGTLAANAFYLTMQMYYFFAFVALGLAIPVVFAGAEEPARESVAPRPSPAALRPAVAAEP
jgi:hypothetical protein